MKTIKSIALSGALMACLVSCQKVGASNEMIEMHTTPHEKGGKNDENSNNDTKMMKQEVSVKKGEIFLVISSITKPGAGEKMNAYFGKVFPIASKHGFKPLASFPIDKVIEGSYVPNNFVGLYSWPNQAAVENFLKDLPQEELTKMRLDIWDELKQMGVMMEKNANFSFDTSKAYEIRTLWTERSTAEVKKYGGKVVFDYPVSIYEDLTMGKKPMKVSLIEWKSAEDAEKFAAMNKSNDGEVFLTHLELKQ